MDHRVIAMIVSLCTAISSLNGEAQTPPPTPHAPPPALLAEARLSALPSEQRIAWQRYLVRSRELHEADRAFMDAELRAAGLTKMRPARVANGFEISDAMSDEWFRSDSARALGESLLTYQTPAGGWSKRVDFSRPRERGQSWHAESDSWRYIGTIDNHATTAQLHFFARLAAAHHRDARYRSAYLRGLEYLMAAQFPNGCWPQVYPLQGGYSDAVTFNDDAIVNVLEVLDDAARGAVPFVPEAARSRAQAAVRRGHECLLAAQVVVNGVRTVWGQQHDPLTLEVIGARSYELPGLSGRESAAVMTYLMTVPNPSPRVADAIHAAAAYFERTKIHGYEYHYQTGLREKAGAGPIWARLREIETNRPIFANRDGIKLYDWNELTDRRAGYAWYGTEPGSALAKYAKWLRTRQSDSSIPVKKQP